MKKILAPTDFSENAFNAIRYTLQLFKDEEIILYLLHVYDLPLDGKEYTPHSAQTMIGEIKQQAQQKLDALAASIGTLNPKVKCYTLLDYTDVATSCAEAINNYQINWIAMGTQGAGGIQKLLGSNTSSVINSTKVPLLVIPSQTKNLQIQKILYATNFNESDLVAIEGISRIAEKNSAELLLLHIKQNSEHEDLLMKCFKNLAKEKISYERISYHIIDKEKEVLKALDYFIDLEKIDLVVMSTRERGFLEQFTNPSLSIKMALHTHIPLVVLQNKNEKTIKSQSEIIMEQLK